MLTIPVPFASASRIQLEKFLREYLHLGVHPFLDYPHTNCWFSHQQLDSWARANYESCNVPTFQVTMPA